MNKNTNKKVKFGVISASNMATKHMRGIKESNNAELIAICDIDKEKLETVANEFDLSNYYTDYIDMLKRDDVDAVIVCTPDKLHAEMTIAALEAKKHVLCEKPMAITVEDCIKMINASKKTGKKLMIGQVARYAPGFKLAKKLIDDGRIGELFYVESEYAHDYKKVPGVGNWRRDPIVLRQPFLGGGCHAVDLLRWIAGDPYEITAYSNHKVLKDWPTDDATVAIMRFPNEVIGKVFVSIGCKRKYTMRSAFYGTKGTIITDNTSPVITIFLESIIEDKEAFNCISEQCIAIKYPVEISSHNVTSEIEEFIDIIINNKNVLTDGREGAYTVAVCNAAIESAVTRKSITIKYGF